MPRERSSWLAELQSSDPDRAAQLADLLELRAREDFDDFLSGPPVIPQQQVAAPGLIGRQVGPYVIDAEIGRGPTASVWRAYRNDGHRSGRVANKFVQAAWISRDSAKRFRVETRSLGLLDHPNIARLLDAGMLYDEQPYLVLEYVDGEPIEAYCNRLQLSVDARVKLFLRVLAALTYAHSHFIAHRSIKTQNVVVTRDGTVKLLDFGVAALIERETPSGRLTKNQAQAPPPRFATPEQLIGLPVTTATDEYSAALVMYLMLIGKHPFHAAGSSTGEFIGAVLLEPAPPASSLGAASSIPSRFLQGDLEHILTRALSKDAASRYVSISSLVEDLYRFLEHQPLRTRASSTPYRAGKFVRRHRVATAALVAAIALTAAITIGAVRHSRPAARNEINGAHG